MMIPCLVQTGTVQVPPHSLVVMKYGVIAILPLLKFAPNPVVPSVEEISLVMNVTQKILMFAACVMAWVLEKIF